MQLFYDQHITIDSKDHLIEPDESNHILRVLRKQIGDELYVTNGKGILFKTIITETTGKKCRIEVMDHQKEEQPSNGIHVAIAPTKSSDRFEYFLEKATEIGISEITPIISQNSERKRLNLKRCHKIIESAMKQSQRVFLPKLNNLTTFEQFLQNTDHSCGNFIAHCEEHRKTEFKAVVRQCEKCCILIGPEGDFSPQEIESALQLDYLPVSLGSKRLRTETAGIHVCSIFAIKDIL